MAQAYHMGPYDQERENVGQMSLFDLMFKFKLVQEPRLIKNEEVEWSPGSHWAVQG